MERLPDDVDVEALHVYDTTLRDGSQQEGLTFSVNEKLSVARLLDDLGVGFVEGGWPGAVPRDTEFFRRAATELDLRTATLVAFGATRRPGAVAADDPQVAALRDAGTSVVTLVAKADVRHVERALRTTPAENLAMVGDTVAHLVGEGRRVFLDAEHFFDGHDVDPAYALEVLRTAAAAGADVAVLCDTNGGHLPDEVADAVHAVVDAGLRVGVHAHDDVGCAVASSLAAVAAGATHVQGCVNGYGERAGNADLGVVAANLELKRATPVLCADGLRELVRVTHAVSELANLPSNAHVAYYGASAFAHKAGLHASAVKVDPDLYQHVDPAVVGGGTRMLVSDLAGRATLELKARELGLGELDREQAGRVVARVKDLEARGFSFETADASVELLLRDEMHGERAHFFELESWRTTVERRRDGQLVSEAVVKVHAKGERILAVGEGNGPVNALDTALRRALEGLFPSLARLELVDYTVRILDGSHGTGAVTRVLVETSDGEGEWRTVGVHENVVEASWAALVEAVTYGLMRAGEEPSSAGRRGRGPPAPTRRTRRGRQDRAHRPGRRRPLSRFRRRRGAARRAPRGAGGAAAGAAPAARAEADRRAAAAAVGPAAGARRAQQGRRDRQELRRPRRGDGRRGAGRAADVPQAEHRRRRPGRPGGPALGRRTRRPRGRARRRHGSAGASGPGGGRARDGLGLHLRERRVGPRPAGPRRAVDPGQGLRLLLPARAVGGDLAGPVRRRRALPGRRRRASGRADVGPGARCRRSDRRGQPGDDAAAGRRGPDGDPGGGSVRWWRVSRSPSRSRGIGSLSNPVLAEDG